MGKGTIRTVRGIVAARWRRSSDGELELDVTMPPTATGRVYVPASSSAAVTEIGAGRAAVERAAGVSLIGVEDGRVVLDFGSGRYRFRVAR